MQKLIVIVGPTASGKTAWAIEIAKKFNGEIISADSRQVYRCMDIGTAKDKGFPHHLTDVINPDEVVSAAVFKGMALCAIGEIVSRGKVPILVGGTAQYIYALVDNWEIPEVPPQPDIREELSAMTLEELIQLLGEKDPEALRIVDTKNKRRVIRALEVVIATNKPFSEQRKKGKPSFDTLLVGIDIPREELNRRIDERTERMMAQGLESEVRRLAVQYSWEAPGMNAIGYREFRAYTEGKETLDQSVFRLKRDTRDVAKRQMTWFRRDRRVHWFQDYQDAEKVVQTFLLSQK